MNERGTFMVRYFVPHDRVRERLKLGTPSDLRELEELINQGTLVELRCPTCGELHLSRLRFLSPFAPCSRCTRGAEGNRYGMHPKPQQGARSGDNISRPPVTLLFAALGDHPLSQLCLGAAARGLSGGDEVLVATDGRSAWDLFLPESLPVRVLETPGESHFLAALSHALLEGRGEYLAVVREGVLVQPGWLEPLISALETHPEAAVASSLLLDRGGRVLHAGYSLSLSQEGAPTLVPLRQGERPGTEAEVQEVPALALHCSVVRRSVAQETGLPDVNSYAPPGNYGDVEWLLKIRMAGWRLLLVHTSRAMRLGEGPAGDGVELDSGSLRNLRLLLERWEAMDRLAGLPSKRDRSPETAPSTS